MTKNACEFNMDSSFFQNNKGMHWMIVQNLETQANKLLWNDCPEKYILIILAH